VITSTSASMSRLAMAGSMVLSAMEQM
jgi:hypothetical protein